MIWHILRRENKTSNEEAFVGYHLVEEREENQSRHGRMRYWGWGNG